MKPGRFSLSSRGQFLPHFFGLGTLSHMGFRFQLNSFFFPPFPPPFIYLISSNLAVSCFISLKTPSSKALKAVCPPTFFCFQVRTCPYILFIFHLTEAASLLEFFIVKSCLLAFPLTVLQVSPPPFNILFQYQ